jgi:tripartite-type tricarboxylate transporter receptor subunit TctC
MPRLLMRAVAVAVGLAMSAIPAPARAADFPTRPVHLLVPYPPGGGLDILARVLSEPLSRIWGQPVVVENRPGAGGVIASGVVAQAVPDGYTLIIVASGHPVNQFLYPHLPYDTFKDFTAITEIGWTPNVVLANKDFPAKTLPDLIAMARAKPGALSYGMPGIGTSGHLAGELLKHMAKIDIVPIPYKGGAPVLTALMAGEIPMSVSVLTEAVGHIRGGSVRALTVTTAQRSPALPDVPTVAEAGLPGYDTSVWWGCSARPAWRRTSSTRFTRISSPRCATRPCRSGSRRWAGPCRALRRRSSKRRCAPRRPNGSRSSGRRRLEWTDDGCWTTGSPTSDL